MHSVEKFSATPQKKTNREIMYFYCNQTDNPTKLLYLILLLPAIKN